MISRVIVPNIGRGVLGAAFVSVALVLGEYTFASLLNYDTLPVAIVLLGKSDAPDVGGRGARVDPARFRAAARAARSSTVAATAGRNQ